MSTVNSSVKAVRGRSTERPRATAPGVAIGDTFEETDTGQAYIVAVDPSSGANAWASIGSATGAASLLVIYANPTTGNDANPGTLAKPVRTFAAALRLVPPSYKGTVTIKLAAGTYEALDVQASEYTFGAPASSSSSGRIEVVGTPAAVATLTTNADASFPGAVLPTGGSPAADLYLGALAVITASPDPSLVGSTRMIVESDTSGDVSLSFPLFAMVPSGTTVKIVRPASVLPIASPLVMHSEADNLVFAMVKFQNTSGGGAAFVQWQLGGGQVSIGDGSEVDLGDISGPPAAWEPAEGTLRFGPEQLAQPVLLGTTTLVFFGTGAYVHAASRDGIGIGYRSLQAMPANISLDTSVVQDCNIELAQQGSFDGEFSMLVNVGVLLNGMCVYTCLFSTSRGYDGATSGAFGPGEIPGACQVTMYASSINDFAGDAIRLQHNMTLTSISSGGTGATGSLYGIRLQDASKALLVGGDSTFAGDAGEVLIDGRTYSPDVPVTYAGLAGTGYVVDSETLCRVAIT